MENLRNSCKFVGRLSKDPKVITNKDGSKKVLITIACENNYKTKGERKAQFVPVQAFVSADKTNTVYDYMHSGDLIAVSCEFRNNDYEKDGEMVYTMVMAIQTVDLLESKAVTTARQAAKVAGKEQAVPESAQADAYIPEATEAELEAIVGAVSEDDIPF